MTNVVLRLLFLVAIPLVALGLAMTTVSAQSEATVEVRVWQGVSNAHNLHISARPEGGSWRTLGTTRLDMSGLSSRGTFRYDDITVTVPLDSEPGPAQVNVEVRVWQSVSDALDLYISARPEGGSWGTLGTIPLDMSGLSSRGTFRYSDIDVAVPLWFVGVGKTGGTTYNAYIMDDGTLFTSILVHDGDGRIIEVGESTFSFRCMRGTLEAIFKIRGSHFFPETTSVEWEIAEQDPVIERWRIGGGVIGDWFYAPDSRFVLERLRGAQSLVIRLRNAEGRILTTDEGDLRIYPHDVSSLLASPAQVNIEHCGDEGWR